MIWLLACQTLDEETLHQRALQQQDPVACQELSEERIAECLSSVIALSAVSDANKTLQSCGAIQQKKWRGECFFLVSDTVELIGEDALSVCAIADPFVQDCLRHAAARDVEQNLLSKTDAKDPLKVMSRIHQIIRFYLPEEISQPMARDMLLRWLADPISKPFDARACQGLPTDMCVQLYLVASLGSGRQWTGEEQWWQHCATGLPLERSEEYGFLPWTEEMAPIISQAWKQICQANQAVRPDGN